jgi:hypothetical protein
MLLADIAQKDCDDIPAYPGSRIIFEPNNHLVGLAAKQIERAYEKRKYPHSSPPSAVWSAALCLHCHLSLPCTPQGSLCLFLLSLYTAPRSPCSGAYTYSR